MTTALSILNSVFGYTQFRAPQAEIINTVIEGRDALVLMPTGGGKSLCYQIPALVRSGCAIVISPLIALMQDQVTALRQLGVSAACLNSAMTAEEVQAVESQLMTGTLDLVYIAPERLTQDRTLALLAEIPLSLFAIDEAHCVSQWGHDFRADYLQLNLLQLHFPKVPRIALTATADERTRTEIIDRLELRDARQFISSFDRPNIQYRIALKHNARAQLLRFIKSEHAGHAGIVYCMSRKKTEDIAAYLRDQGLQALSYHAGMHTEERTEHQDRFLREDGIIIVATIAFGMGIDKPDVRFVAHLDMPKTVESYYQETGRAGRDGEPATAWLIYGLQDIIKLRQLMTSSTGSEAFKRAEQHRLNAMLGLCEITSCRRQALLAYFGESYPTKCGNCDCCLDPAETWDATEAARMALSVVYRTGQRFGVNHLIDVLRGSENDKIFQFDHHHLAVHGVGKELDANQWRSVFRQLVAQAFLSVDIDGYGALQLEEKCRPLLQGTQSIHMRRDPTPKRAGRQQTRTALPDDIDIALWEALRDCRRELAEAQGVPPYVIFHDKTLQEMCRDQPQNAHQLGRISGVGERKLNKYGADFIRVIKAHTVAPGEATLQP
ncbi:MAG: DNA helicase RecQ [Pseudomonadota bacterium]